MRGTSGLVPAGSCRCVASSTCPRSQAVGRRAGSSGATPRFPRSMLARSPLGSTSARSCGRSRPTRPTLHWGCNATCPHGPRRARRRRSGWRWAWWPRRAPARSACRPTAWIRRARMEGRMDHQSGGPGAGGHHAGRALRHRGDRSHRLNRRAGGPSVLRVQWGG